MTPRRFPLHLLALALLVIAAMAGTAGCGSGGSSTQASASDGGGGSAGTMEGTIAIAGGKLTVTPHTGATKTFTVTANTEPAGGQLAAIAASGELARVQFRDGDALVVTKKSDVLKELKAVSGIVTAADPKALTLTIKDDVGKSHHFVIDSADAQAMDLAHLRDDHMPAKTKVAVYYDVVGGKDHARGFEDL